MELDYSMEPVVRNAMLGFGMEGMVDFESVVAKHDFAKTVDDSMVVAAAVAVVVDADDGGDAVGFVVKFEHSAIVDC